MTQVESKLGRIYVSINNDLENEFRLKCVALFGPKQGNLSEGVNKAIKLWLLISESPEKVKEFTQFFEKDKKT